MCFFSVIRLFVSCCTPLCRHISLLFRFEYRLTYFLYLMLSRLIRSFIPTIRNDVISPTRYFLCTPSLLVCLILSLLFPVPFFHSLQLLTLCAMCVVDYDTYSHHVCDTVHHRMCAFRFLSFVCCITFWSFFLSLCRVHLVRLRRYLCLHRCNDAKHLYRRVDPVWERAGGTMRMVLYGSRRWRSMKPAISTSCWATSTRVGPERRPAVFGHVDWTRRGSSISDGSVRSFKSIGMTVARWNKRHCTVDGNRTL